MPKEFVLFLTQIFKDVDDSYSAKRTGFFIFIALLAVCVVAGVFYKIVVPSMIFNGVVDLIKWIGTAILGERAPAMFSAIKGNLPAAIPAPVTQPASPAQPPAPKPH